MTSATTLRFEWVTDPERFLALREQWNAFSASAIQTIFLTHAWLAAWLEELAPDAELHVMTAWDGDRLAAAFPLFESREAGYGRRWTVMGTGTLTPNHLDVIAEPAFLSEARDGFVDMLLDARASWDTLDLDKLPADTDTASAFESAFAAAGLPTSCEVSALCPYCDLPASYEEYVASRKKRVRRKIRETQRWLEDPGAARVLATADTEAAALAAQESLVEFHQARWKEKGYPGAFADSRVVRFHENVIRATYATGNLRMFTLSEDGQTIAVSYNFRIASLVQAYLSSFDERWSDARPGVVLRTYVMEQAILEGASRFDFLQGTEKYKAAWCTSERENLRLLIFNKTLAGRAAHLRYVADETTVLLARRFVPEQLREQVVKLIARKDAARQPEESDS